MANKILGVLNMEPAYVDVEGIEDYRPISAASILGRYRVADFMLSNFTNSGIDNIKVHLKNRPRSLVEHVSRTNYNINSKRGKIHLLHDERPIQHEIYNNDIMSFDANMEFVEISNAKYVIVAPSHFIFVEDFSKLFEHHARNKNDITILYQNVHDADQNFLMCDVVLFDDTKKRIVDVRKNRGKYKTTNISLETYVMSKELFIKLVNEAKAISSLYNFSDVVYDHCEYLKIGSYQHRGFCACLSTLKAYYDANMTIREQGELNKLFSDNWPIYTMTNDSCPTLYKTGANVSGSIVANGCEIEGTIINSVIGRNVVIKKGAVIKDSVIFPDVYIGNDVKMDCVIVDRLAKVKNVKELKGSADSPVYVKRRDSI